MSLLFRPTVGLEQEARKEEKEELAPFLEMSMIQLSRSLCVSVVFEASRE